MTDPTWFDNPAITQELLPATIDTILMTGFAAAFTAVLGLLLGIALYVLSPHSVQPRSETAAIVKRVVYFFVGLVVDFGRSIPFIILMIALIPFTRFMVGSALGWQATVVPLTVSAIPFFARLVEGALRDVNEGKVEAVQMMGASTGQLVRQVYLPEAMPGLVTNFTVTIVSLIGYTAMAGAVGGGGLGALAISYGYQRYQGDVMIACVILLVAIVALVQLVGNSVSRAIDHRKA